MKILTKEEEEAHYNATLKGGALGGTIGLGVGLAAVTAAHHRFATFRGLTLPMKAFLVTSSTTFASIVSADRASRNYEISRDPARQYKDKASTDLNTLESQKSTFQRAKDWGRENRYPLVTASWVASMAIALGLVGRNPYLSSTQKLVQARVYAQGLTLAVLIATAAFEVGDASKGKGRWETVKVLDPNDPEHKHLIEKRIHHEAYQGEDLWRDMVAAEERKMGERKQAAHKEADDKHAENTKKTSHKEAESKKDESPKKAPSKEKSKGDDSKQEQSAKKAPSKGDDKKEEKNTKQDKEPDNRSAVSGGTGKTSTPANNVS